MTLGQIKDLATILGVIIALATLIKASFEYVKQGAQKRAEKFSEIERRIKDNKEIYDIISLLETDDPSLSDLEYSEKFKFVGVYEEIALMMNSGLIKKRVAHYMFGYYAIRCWESDNFWKDINRNSPYWSLFRIFAEEMQKIESKFKTATKHYRF